MRWYYRLFITFHFYLHQLERFKCCYQRKAIIFAVFNLVLAGFSWCIWSISIMYLLYSDMDVCVKTSHLGIHMYTCSVQQFDISEYKRLTSSHNSCANRIPLLHLICVMKSFWSGWKDDTNIQREEIAITVICIFVSNRTLSLCNCKRNAWKLYSSQASKVYNKNMLQRSVTLLCICDQILYVWDSCGHDPWESSPRHLLL